jgi:hypothetical protein
MLCLARCGMRTWTWARLSRLGRLTGCTSHHRAAAARTPDTAAMQPAIEDTTCANNMERIADSAFCACRALVARQSSRPRTWA